jgi:superfamily II DNA or RNA helicase
MQMQRQAMMTTVEQTTSSANAKPLAYYLEGMRDYQVDMLRALWRDIAAGHRGIYAVLPTGCGKTRVGGTLLAMKAELGHRSLWVVHTRELVRQAADAIAAIAPPSVRVGVVMAESDESDADIVVGSIQTLRNPERIAACGMFTGAVVIDECHHIRADNGYASLAIYAQETMHCPVVGLTATPFRADGEAIERVLPRCSFERSIPDMIAAGWLVDLRYRAVEIPGLDLSDCKLVRRLGAQDFADADIAQRVENADVISATVDATVETLRDRPGPALAFGASVAHARMLADAYNRAGIRAGAIWGDMPRDERDQILEAWRLGPIKLVANCAVLTEGFDYPAIETVVIARPTMSVGLYTQMVGRGTRIADGKTDCVILDITGRMPARAVPVHLDDLMGEELSAEEDGEVVIDRKRLVSPRPQGHALRDPFGRARFSWTHHPVPALTGVWYAPVAERFTAVLIPDPWGRGLVMPWLVTSDSVQPAGSDWVPRRRAIADIEASLARAHVASKSLSRKDRAWRNLPPTDAQMSMLRRLSYVRAYGREIYQAAAREGWSRGDVSLAIDALVIEPQVRKALRMSQQDNGAQGGAEQ